MQQQTQETESNSTFLSDPNWDTKTTASYLNLSPRTLERWRIEGKGPAYSKLGSRVIYSPPDVVSYQKQNVRTSTSQKA